MRVSGVLPLEKDRVVLEQDTVSLEPGERKTLGFDVARDVGPIEVRIDADALAIDDRAVLVPSPRTTVSLRTNLSPDAARALGLSIAGGSIVGRWLQIAPDVVEARDDDSAHVLLTDRESGGPATWTLRFARLGTARRDFIGPFLAEKRHPLLEGTTLEGIVWSADPDLLLEGAPIVAAGNLPLLVEERTGDKRAYALDLDPARSSLQRSPDWPILLSNLVEERRRELPGAAVVNLVVGEETTWRSAESERDDVRLHLRGPGLDRELGARAALVLGGFDQPGLYALSQGGDVLARFGVRFQDALESDLRNLSSGTRAASVGAADAPPSASWIEMVLIGAVLAALLFDWFLLDRFAGARSAGAHFVQDRVRGSAAG